MTLRDRILLEVPGIVEGDLFPSGIRAHFPDLCIVAKPGVMEWLRRHYPKARIETFTDSGGVLCYCVPFMWEVCRD